ncbi:hypothetical protein PP515_gp34 [Gordonia phage Sidious]|uniref:Uncharacterized protein n=1 Tax=Gordonia phage Sidious TaxID=2591118 RepID=A0A515MI90_9CAUD|nr:hypothetical protein PP515_gp34 [Gordonia phage Sidious]QDM56381.1 hypothetical protein SEA_SIDIOUS_34 [Gordonia phage Sidious]
MEPHARCLRPTNMVFDVLAVIVCVCAGGWLVIAERGPSR